MNGSPARGLRRRKLLSAIAPALVTVGFAAPLISHAIVGTNMRYSGDDYCYAGLYRRLGILETLRTTYTGPAPFIGNRFSATFFTGLADTLGPMVSAVLPGLMILLLFVGWSFSGIQLSRAFELRISTGEVLAGVAVLLFATVSATPDPIQSLYWRSAILPYLTPLVGLGFVLGLGVLEARQDKPRIRSLAALFVVSLIVGGFSETGTALQLTVLAIAGIAMLSRIGESTNQLRSRRSVLYAAAAGSIVAAVLLIIAPTGHSQLRVMQQEFLLTQFGEEVLESAYLFTYAILFRNAQTISVAFILSLWIASQNIDRIGWNVSWPRLTFALLAITGSALALLFSGLAPAAIALSGYPPGRTLLGMTFFVTAGVMAVGVVSACALGRLLGRHFSAARFGITALSLTLTAFPLLSANSVLNDLPRFEKWSGRWDQRHSDILHLRSSGAREIEVMLFDNIIPDVAELQPDPDYWYNNCAEWYYDLRSLSATLPGWDE